MEKSGKCENGTALVWPAGRAGWSFFCADLPVSAYSARSSRQLAGEGNEYMNGDSIRLVEDDKEIRQGV